jgi:hypothetical protein
MTWAGTSCRRRVNYAPYETKDRPKRSLRRRQAWAPEAIMYIALALSVVLSLPGTDDRESELSVNCLNQEPDSCRPGLAVFGAVVGGLALGTTGYFVVSAYRDLNRFSFAQDPSCLVCGAIGSAIFGSATGYFLGDVLSVCGSPHGPTACSGVPTLPVPRLGREPSSAPVNPAMAY